MTAGIKNKILNHKENALYTGTSAVQYVSQKTVAISPTISLSNSLPPPLASSE